MPESNATEELLSLLRLEREAIRSADFADLVGLSDRKERAMAALADLDRDTVEQIRALARENQTLLAAALAGVRAAQARLKTIVTAAKGFDSYDKEGRPQPIRRGSGDFERRA
ncbi:FlgN protein [Thioclava sp. ES.031]|uniref:flagellar export chaperone FlgN n=1 Tax=Thioclava sp. ES.031 TaxID=1798203 RepID=UPI000BF50534|nr:flagellar export chaperone FlgN [Thioclava sp. ES.031]PFG65045.1 FlgN protein [Thioclava sp. ES.031]